jgi:activator of HSP90 ATPase
VNRETKTIKQTQLIPAKPIDVYQALIDGKKHSDFTGSKATSNPKIGGKFTAWDGYIFGKHLKLEKAKKIVQEWETTEWPSGFPPSRVEFVLKEIKGGTEMTLFHSDVPAEQVDSYRQGWIDFYWKPMKQYFKKRNRQESRVDD